jgi:hypothetical protein
MMREHDNGRKDLGRTSSVHARELCREESVHPLAAVPEIEEGSGVQSRAQQDQVVGQLSGR